MHTSWHARLNSLKLPTSWKTCDGSSHRNDARKLALADWHIVCGAILLALPLSALACSDAFADGPTSRDCEPVFGSELVDPAFPPPGERPLVSSVICQDRDANGQLLGISAESTTGDGTAIISNADDVTITPSGESPLIPSILRAGAGPQYIEWLEFPGWGYKIPDDQDSGPIELPVYSSGPAPFPTDYYSGTINIQNSGDLTTMVGPINPITALGSIGTVTIGNSGRIVASGDGMAAIFAITGVDDTARLKGDGPYLWNFGLPGVYYPGGRITITNSGAIDVSGTLTYAIRGDSLAGGVTIANTAAVTMHGSQSNAIFAEGWSGDLSVTNSGPISITGADATGLAAELYLSGNVSITNTGAINIDGDRGIGIFARNAEAGDTPAPASTLITGSGAIAVAGEEATGIDATNRLWGSLSVDYSGAISVNGTHAIGIAAATDEDADVSVHAKGNVTASGSSAIGIAVGGVGEATGPAPDGTLTPSNNGHLSVEVDSGVTVRGGATAASGYDLERLAAGVAFVGGADNSLINRGTIAADSGLAVVAFEGLQLLAPEDGEDSLINFVAGPIAIQNYGAIDGDIRTGAGNDTLINAGNGVISGDIDLGGGTNSIENRDNAIINSGDEIAVGAGNLFNNAGIVSPGGLGVTQRTVVIGNFVQTSSGRFLVDINDASGQRSDQLDISGTATVAGLIVPHVVNMNSQIAKEYLILSAQGGVTSAGLGVSPSSVTVQDTVGYDFGLAYTPNSIYLTATQNSTIQSLVEGAVSQTPDGPVQNLKAVGGTLQQIESGDPGAMRPLLQALRLQGDSADLANALNRLVPQSTGGQTANTSGAGITLGNAMFSCAQRDGPYAYTREGECYYAKVTARRAETDASGDGPGATETGYGALGGFQVALWDQVRFGLAAGYEQISSKSFDAVQNLATSDGDRVHVGMVIKNQWGPVNAYLNFTGSYALYDNIRYVGLGAGMDTALSDQDVWSGIARLRFSYLNDMGPWYWKPLIDLAATYINFDGYTETGAGAANLRVSSVSDWLFSVMPGLEIGGQARSADGTLYRPYARAGVIVYDHDDINVTTTFDSSPAGVTPFIVHGNFDQVAADVEAGLIVLLTSGVNVKLNYEGRYSEDTTQHGGSLKVSAPW